MAFESLILDARGNPFQGSIDGITGETFTDARASTASLGALNAESLIDIQGKASLSIILRSAAFTGSVILEGTIDGTTYDVTPIPMFNILTETYTGTQAGAGALAVALTAEVAGLRRVRARVNTYTSGTVTVGLRSTSADLFLYARDVPSNQQVSVTAAANTIVTATLPAAGTGLYHYITNINLTRGNNGAAVAGTATLVHTTTNLPGSMAWVVGNAMAAGGQQLDLDYTPTTPLKSSVSNTATTVVMQPAGATVINRVNVTYYIGA